MKVGDKIVSKTEYGQIAPGHVTMTHTCDDGKLIHLITFQHGFQQWIFEDILQSQQRDIILSELLNI